MINIKNQKFNLIKFVEVLFYTFPLSFIVGNLILSIHLVLFIITSSILIKKEKISFKFGTIHWLLVIFFLYVLISTFIQFQSPGFLYEKTKDWPLESHPAFKSFTLLRYLILGLIINILFVNNIIKLKKLFFFSLLCTSFVSIDIIIQYFVGADIFGYLKNIDRNSGPFGNEHIAGAYLLKFSFLSFFGFFLINKNIKYKNILLVLTISMHVFATLLAGNRMSTILLLFGCFLIFILDKNLRSAMLYSAIVFLVLFSGLLKYDRHYNNLYITLFNEINILKFTKIYKDNSDKPVRESLVGGSGNIENKPVMHGRRDVDLQDKFLLGGSGHRSIFLTSIWMWKMRPVTGFGLKSFRVKCWDILTMIKNSVFARKANLNCSTHSHNYYLEILAETGIIGLTLLVLSFSIVLKNCYICLKKYYQTKDHNFYYLLPIILIIFIEIWPIKSSGSFFTTWNATYFWLFFPLLFNFKKN